MVHQKCCAIPLIRDDPVPSYAPFNIMLSNGLHGSAGKITVHMVSTCTIIVNDEYVAYTVYTETHTRMPCTCVYISSLS